MSIGEAAGVLSVCTKTLRRWDKRGILKPAYRTAGLHRRYNRRDIAKILEERLVRDVAEGEPKEKSNLGDIKPRCALYGRVSSSKQRKGGDLERQIGKLRDFSRERGYSVVREYRDVGSGINDTRRGLIRLLKDAANNKFDVVVVNYNDRLARFGIRIIEEFLSSWGVRLEVINPTIISDESPYSNLVTDLTAILYSFMGKLYRIRRGPKKSKTEGQEELKSKDHKATNKPATAASRPEGRRELSHKQLLISRSARTSMIFFANGHPTFMTQKYYPVMRTRSR
ncbi:MAG: IS607 family transposase [Promethearchaeota archaeon]